MDKRIKFLLDTFDFERVHAYMLISKWEWGVGTDKNGKCIDIGGVPSVENLKHHAQFMLKRVLLDDDFDFLSLGPSGGFFAFKLGKEIHLTFNVSQTSIAFRK